MTQQKRDYHIFLKLNKTHPWWLKKVVVIGMRCLFFPLWLPAVTQLCILPDSDKVYLLSSLWQETSGQLYKNTTQRAHPLDVNLVHVHLVYIWSFDTVTGSAQLVPLWKYLPACSIWMHRSSFTHLHSSLHITSCSKVVVHQICTFTHKHPMIAYIAYKWLSTCFINTFKSQDYSKVVSIQYLHL